MASNAVSNASRMGNATSKMGNATSKMGNATNRIGNSITNVKSKMSDKMPIIIIIGVTILLFIFVILYITFAMKSSALKGKVLTNTPLKLDKLDTPLVISNGDMAKPTVGREYSYGFWMYMEDFKQTNKHKLIMYRGNPDDVAAANPLIFMDNKSNKLYVVIKTTESSLSNGTKSNLNSIITDNYFLSDKDLDDPSVNKHLILTYDYIPLQRWVHLAVVVDNKLVTLYMDGELYSVKSVDEFKAARQPYVTRLGKVVDYNLLIEKSDGDLFIGKSSVGDRITINGYIGKVEYFNYALTIKEVKKCYETGPLSSGFLSKFGLSQYGFRSPVYKLNEVSA
jgi:hypothetical protein